jgi:tetratricopeptide (TPR) repeat protein
VAADPGDLEARLALAGARAMVQLDWSGAESDYRDALEIDPEAAEAHWEYAWFLMLLGRHEESLPEMEVALGLAPESAEAHWRAVWVKALAGETTKAGTHALRARQLSPGSGEVLSAVFALELLRGREREAVDAALTHLQVSSSLGQGVPPRLMTELREAAVQSGLEGFMRSWIEFNVPRAGAPCWLDLGLPRDPVTAYTVAGDADQALACLEQAHEERRGLYAYMRVWPLWDDLRDQPRFTDLLEKVGLAADS